VCRVNAREAAYDTAARGARLVLGAGSGNADNMLAQTNFAAIQAKMTGITEDMDKISAKLREIFRK
jgi:hypothetical protein